MKIAHLSVGDPFTARWVNAQTDEGYDVHLIMLQPAEEEIKDTLPAGQYRLWKLILMRIRPNTGVSQKCVV